MDFDELEAIEDRANAASPGPWLLIPALCGPDGQGVYESEDFGIVVEVGDPYPRGNNKPQENMEFIAHARTDVPALIAEIRRLNNELAQARLDAQPELKAKITDAMSRPLQEAILYQRRTPRTYVNPADGGSMG